MWDILLCHDKKYCSYSQKYLLVLDWIYSLSQILFVKQDKLAWNVHFLDL